MSAQPGVTLAALVRYGAVWLGVADSTAAGTGPGSWRMPSVLCAPGFIVGAPVPWSWPAPWREPCEAPRLCADRPAERFIAEDLVPVLRAAVWQHRAGAAAAWFAGPLVVAVPGRLFVAMLTGECEEVADQVCAVGHWAPHVEAAVRVQTGMPAPAILSRAFAAVAAVSGAEFNALGLYRLQPTAEEGAMPDAWLCSPALAENELPMLAHGAQDFEDREFARQAQALSAAHGGLWLGVPEVEALIAARVQQLKDETAERSSVSRVADALGVDRSTVQRMVNKHSVRR